MELAQTYRIPNRLAFDVEFYAHNLIEQTKAETNYLYYANNGKRPSVYFWIKFGKCANSICQKDVPLFKQYYLSKPRTNKNTNRIKHFVLDTATQTIQVTSGNTSQKPTINRGALCCPYCKSITSTNEIKEQFIKKTIKEQIIGLVYDEPTGKQFVSSSKDCQDLFTSIPDQEIPFEKLSTFQCAEKECII